LQEFQRKANRTFIWILAVMERYHYSWAWCDHTIFQVSRYKMTYSNKNI
jgi:hypothetical protein